MKNRKRDIIYLFICTLPVSAWMIYWFIREKEYRSLPWSLLPQAFMVLCIGIMILQEKHILKKENKIKNRSETDMRQEVLENYEKNIFRDIRSKSMAKDLKNICRTKLSPFSFLFGMFFLTITLFLFWSMGNYSESTNIKEIIFVSFTSLITVGCVFTSIYEFAGLPVYFFMKKHRGKTDAVERSYLNGKMICGKICGLNVGIDHCVYYDLFSIDCFPVENILCAEVTKKIKKEKSTSGFYHKVKQEISIKINVKDNKFPYKMEFTELQLEYICDELMRRGVDIIKKI